MGCDNLSPCRWALRSQVHHHDDDDVDGKCDHDHDRGDDDDGYVDGDVDLTGTILASWVSTIPHVYDTHVILMFAVMPEWTQQGARCIIYNGPR